MGHFDELSIDLKEGAVVGVVWELSEFDEERARALHDPFRKPNAQTSKGFLKANLASIKEADKLYLAIVVAGLCGCIFLFDMLVFFGFSPDV